MLQTQQKNTVECFGKVTPKRSNARILKGLISLSHEIKSQENTERDTKLLKADIDAMHKGIYMSYGISYKSFSLNFRRWVALTKTTREEFAKLLIPENLQYDGDTLLLTLGTVEMWFEGYYFEGHVGAQTVMLDYGEGIGVETVLDAREYLEENWKDLAADFILHNLNHAEISDDLIEELI